MEFVKLGDVVDIKTGKLDVNAENPNGKYPFFTCSKKHTYIDDYAFDGEYILVAGNGDLNVKYYLGKFNAYQRTYVIKPSNTIDGKYLYYFLETYLKILRNQSIGGVIKYIKLGNLTEALIPLPSLEVQKAIAARLDKADQIRQLNQQIINHYDELIQALFIDMFGDPMKNEMRWQENELDNVCIKITDGEHTTPKRELKGIYLLSARNVRNGFIDLSAGVDYIGDEEYNRISKRCSPEKNDILMSCSGSVGRVSIVNVDYKFSLVRSVALIKPKSNLINSIYLNNYMLTLYFQHQILKYSKKSSQSNIFLGSIKKLKVHLPPLELQNQFAERVQKIEAQKELAVQALQQSEDLFNSLLQQAFKK